jgi:NTP pyrophosphatase (non-canonical NTP hydrolase)
MLRFATVTYTGVANDILRGFMSELRELTQKAIEFRNARNWAQFHNPKDLAICLSVEAAELAELFLWKKPEEADSAKLKDELSDVLHSVLLLAEHYKIDLHRAFLDKLEKNAQKYPVEKSWGSNKKYDEEL